MSTALFTHQSSHEHLTPSRHPECVARAEVLERALDDLDLQRETAPQACYEDLARVHVPSYIDAVFAAAPQTGLAQMDGDTYMSPGSLRAALCAVGAAQAATQSVVEGQSTNAFVAMRPPGHHAEKARAMGFCLFGTVALAAQYALDVLGLERVAVVDFDVHHGNGTQDLLWDEARALFISSHQMPLWPGSGASQERGAHDNVVNIPLDPGSDGAEMRDIYRQTVFPRISEFSPDLILVSAGFDAHRADPLANLNWETEDFAWLGQEISALADKICAGRLVSCLEGGYDLPALAQSGRAYVNALIEAG